MNKHLDNILIFNGIALLFMLIIFIFINFGLYICFITDNIGTEFGFLCAGLVLNILISFLNYKSMKQAIIIKDGDFEND